MRYAKSKLTPYYLANIEHIAFKLLIADVPFEFMHCVDGAKLQFSWAGNGDIALNWLTVGNRSNCVESYGLPCFKNGVAIPLDAAADTIIEMYKAMEEG